MVKRPGPARPGSSAELLSGPRLSGSLAGTRGVSRLDSAWIREQARMAVMGPGTNRKRLGGRRRGGGGGCPPGRIGSARRSHPQQRGSGKGAGRRLRSGLTPKAWQPIRRPGQCVAAGSQLRRGSKVSAIRGEDLQAMTDVGKFVDGDRLVTAIAGTEQETMLQTCCQSSLDIRSMITDQ